MKAIQLPAPRAGAYRFRAEVRQRGRLLDENGFEFRIGADTARRAPCDGCRACRSTASIGLAACATPPKVSPSGCATHDAGLGPAHFTIERRRPAHRLWLRWISSWGGVTRQVSTITPQAPFYFPSAERLTIVVHGLVLPPGAHEMEITLQILGIGEIPPACAISWIDGSLPYWPNPGIGRIASLWALSLSLGIAPPHKS